MQLCNQPLGHLCENTFFSLIRTFRSGSPDHSFEFYICFCVLQLLKLERLTFVKISRRRPQNTILMFSLGLERIVWYRITLHVDLKAFGLIPGTIMDFG